MQRSVLIIEDDPGIRLSIKDEFEYEGYGIHTAGTAEEGFSLLQKERPDLIILDIMLPDMDGYEFCKRVRSGNDMIPIIILTVRNKEIDKVLGLELGADDYITKPFSLRELLARVKTVLRRTEGQRRNISTYDFGPITLDFLRYEATKENQVMNLTPLEFHMLKLLIGKKGEVVTRDCFLDEIWGRDNIKISYRTVDSHIANIRKKIEEDPSHPRHIISVRGVGYRFVD
jgi:two-component system alkaline phosphatase synthesis response regulator PhoP